MDNQDIRTLKLLEEIENSQSHSQRYLSKRLNISLGLMNSFIKRLAHKGLFKITTIPKNRVKYILTPKGVMEKTRLTYEYIQYSFEFYKDASRRLQELFEKLSANGEKKIVFYGIGDLAEIAYISIKKTDSRLIAVVDEVKPNTRFIDMTVELPKRLDTLPFDTILITAIDDQEIIYENLKEKGIPKNKIILF